MKTLETTRLILRQWQADDLDDFYAYAKNPHIGPSAGWQPHRNKAESQAILNSFMKQKEAWAIVYRPNNKVIGSLGLHQDSKRMDIHAKMIGYVLAQDYWGQGIMVEAVQRVIKYCFEDLMLDVVSAYHYPFNLQSKRVLQKCGFVYEGTLRKAHQIFNGAVYDDVCYSILKQEYFDAKQHLQR